MSIYTIECTVPPAEVARRAKRHGLPVIALAGTLGKGVALNRQHGIDAYASIMQRPCSLEEAITKAGRLLVKATEEVMRMVRVGALLAPQKNRRGVKPTGQRAKLAQRPLRSPGKSRTRMDMAAPMFC